MKLTAIALAIGVIGLSSAVAVADSLPVPGSTSHSQHRIEQRLNAWENLVVRLRNMPHSTRLEEVNRFFNGIRFRSDQLTWGKEDFWALPSEFLRRGLGDCEDYAIAKYITLRRLGVDDKKLRLAYVRSLTLRQAHMVLLVDTGNGEQLVLDNLVDTLKPPSKRNDLAPVYAFNGSDLWLLDADYNERLIGKSSRLPQWRSLIGRSTDYPI